MSARIKGEYWIEPDGEILFADGDVGDRNHEGYVLERARQKVLELFGLDSDADRLDEHEFSRLLTTHLKDEAAPGVDPFAESGTDDLRAPLRAWLVENDSDPESPYTLDELWPAAMDQTDLRAFAIKEWNWAWVRGNNVAVQSLGPDVRRQLARGMDAVLDQEGFEPEDDDDLVLTISLQSTGKTVALSVAELAEASPTPRTERPDWEAAGVIARESVKRIEAELEHPFYRQHDNSGIGLS